MVIFLASSASRDLMPQAAIRPQRAMVPRAWAALRGDAKLAGELDRLLAAAEARFGAEGMRAFARGAVPEGTKLAPAERAAGVESRRLAASQRAGQGPRAKM